MTKAQEIVLESMRADIKAAARTPWRCHLRCTVRTCDLPKDRDRHNRIADEQALLCQDTYLATARDRLKRYKATGEIRSVSGASPPAYG